MSEHLKSIITFVLCIILCNCYAKSLSIIICRYIHACILAYVIAYVILSGLSALIMHSLCSEFLFFHSPGNFSFSGHSLSVNFFQRLAEPWSKINTQQWPDSFYLSTHSTLKFSIKMIKIKKSMYILRHKFIYWHRNAIAVILVHTIPSGKHRTLLAIPKFL